jgi:hypothetical protein
MDVSMVASTSLAASASMSSGTSCTSAESFPALPASQASASASMPNARSMTSGGCPSAATRFTTRPSASSSTVRPSPRSYASTCGRTSGCTSTASPASARTSISTSKWPALARMAPSRIIAMCSALITSTEPVAVMNTSPSGAARAIGSTRKPRSEASSARTGLTSVTITWAPKPRARSATPRPLAPNPATTTVFPASSVLVARRMPSIADWPVPQVLSTRRLAGVSFAATTGNASAPSAAIRRSLITPVVVDSQPPLTLGSRFAARVCSVLTRSPPSSMTSCGPSGAWVSASSMWR